MPDQHAKIKHHQDGTPYVRPYLGLSPVTGKPMRPYHQLPPDMADDELQAEADRWLAEQRAGLRLGTALRLTDYLEQFILYRERVGEDGRVISANTAKQWRTIKDNYLMGLALRDPRTIEAQDVADLLMRLRVVGGTREQGLSGATVRSVHEFLCLAFDWIERQGLPTRRPMLGVGKPGLGGDGYDDADHDDVDDRALTRDGLAKLVPALSEELARTPDDVLGARRHVDAFAAWLALQTGMRCGETCAVRRMDLRGLGGDAPYLSVSGTVTEPGGLKRQPWTKGRKSRNVELDTSIVTTIEAYLAWQDGLLGGSRNKRTVVSATGRLRAPSAVERGFRQIARECGLPDCVTFHYLRHTHATWLLREGVSVREVQQRIGHADPATTLRYYAKALPEGRRDAAARFARVAREIGGNG